MGLQTMPLRFRVWDKEDKSFLTDQYDNIHFVNLYWLGNFMCHELEEEEYEISQDTGLKDKNGKSIFTGDILFSGIYYVEVRYEYGEVVGYRPKDGVYCGFLELMQLRGNIWQNPELLEDKTIDKS